MPEIRFLIAILDPAVRRRVSLFVWMGVREEIVVVGGKLIVARQVRFKYAETLTEYKRSCGWAHIVIIGESLKEGEREVATLAELSGGVRTPTIILSGASAELYRSAGCSHVAQTEADVLSLMGKIIY